MSLKLPLPIPVDGDVERGNEIVESTLLPPFPSSQPCTPLWTRRTASDTGAEDMHHAR